MAESSITFSVNWRRKMRGLATAFVLPAGLVLAGCSVTVNNSGDQAVRAYKSEAGPSVETVSAMELAKLVEAGEVVLIDVRTPAEFAEERLAGALNAPVRTFEPAAMPRDETREVILYCRSSGRSERAAKMLAEYWGGTVRHMEGGIIAWNEADLPTIQ